MHTTHRQFVVQLMWFFYFIFMIMLNCPTCQKLFTRTRYWHLTLILTTHWIVLQLKYDKQHTFTDFLKLTSASKHKGLYPFHIIKQTSSKRRANIVKSYTVPILKVSNVYGKSLTVKDFRGVSISPVISKVLEHCILHQYEFFFETCDNQFGFKKRLGCRDAVYTFRCVDYYVSCGSTVNVGAVDLSKAFDKMNHHEKAHFW